MEDAERSSFFAFVQAAWSRAHVLRAAGPTSCWLSEPELKAHSAAPAPPPPRSISVKAKGMTVTAIKQPKPPALAYVRVRVPEGKCSGDEIPYEFTDSKGAVQTVMLVVPGKSLLAGDTFEVADPATSVTVFGREASMRNAFCTGCLNCGPYDEVCPSG